MAPDHAVVIESLHPFQQFCHLFPDFRMAQDILKHPAPEGRDRRIRGHAPHHLGNQHLLLRLDRQLFRQGIHSEVVPGFLRNHPVFHPVLVREKQAQLISFHLPLYPFRRFPILGSFSLFRFIILFSHPFDKIVFQTNTAPAVPCRCCCACRIRAGCAGSFRRWSSAVHPGRQSCADTCKGLYAP